VSRLRANVKAGVAAADKGAGLNRRRVVETAVADELAAMLDGGPRPPDPKKGKPMVVMFVGLQGAGKTTTCGKYAHFYNKKGFKPAMVCADTFRAGAFDQLKQNATKAGIPFYGSHAETDPAAVAKAGVDKFKQDRRDVIIVDTSGRHKQEEALFEEMRQVGEGGPWERGARGRSARRPSRPPLHQVADAVRPDLVIFVMDGSIGQAAFDQAAAFRESVDVGAVILTKMDGHARGGGALSAVAATGAPIVFMGTGEHMDELERFEAKPFVGRLLGRGDWKGFVDRIQDVAPGEEEQEALMDKIGKVRGEGGGVVSFRRRKKTKKQKLTTPFSSPLSTGPLHHAHPVRPARQPTKAGPGGPNLWHDPGTLQRRPLWRRRQPGRRVGAAHEAVHDDDGLHDRGGAGFGKRQNSGRRAAHPAHRARRGPPAGRSGRAL
jgi:signal recognition particle subunit SRP54